jgi:hypothetical protein
MAWADYFNEVCGVAIDRNMHDAAESLGFMWTLDGICFASERPREILRDNQGRLHNDSGMAIRYPSGWGLYRVHGVEVPRDIIEDRASITVARIDAEQNAEVRRVMVELYGAGRYLLDSGARELQRDEAGILYRKEIANDEPLVMVRVLNPTPEPDGVLSRDEAIKLFGSASHRIHCTGSDSRFKEYFIRVSPECRPLLADGTQGSPQKLTARNAVAASYGLRGDEYDDANGVMRT